MPSPAQVQALIAKWRQMGLKRIGDVKNLTTSDLSSYGHARYGQALCLCADELEAVLRESPPPHPQTAEICICAAVQFADGRIVRGHRHDSCFITAAGWTPKPDGKGHVQGFITSRNRFVGRKEGAALHNAAGIVSAQTGKPIPEILFSEDLYFDTHDHVAWNTPYTEPLGDSTPAPSPEFTEAEIAALRIEFEAFIKARNITDPAVLKMIMPWTPAQSPAEKEK